MCGSNTGRVTQRVPLSDDEDEVAASTSKKGKMKAAVKGVDEKGEIVKSLMLTY